MKINFKRSTLNIYIFHLGLKAVLRKTKLLVAGLQIFGNTSQSTLRILVDHKVTWERQSMTQSPQLAALLGRRVVLCCQEGTNRRPADIFIPRWAGGRKAALEVMVTQPLKEQEHGPGFCATPSPWPTKTGGGVQLISRESNLSQIWQSLLLVGTRWGWCSWGSWGQLWPGTRARGRGRPLVTCSQEPLNCCRRASPFSCSTRSQAIPHQSSEDPNNLFSLLWVVMVMVMVLHCGQWDLKCSNKITSHFRYETYSTPKF